jgi:hypothetical protein
MPEIIMTLSLTAEYEDEGVTTHLGHLLAPPEW